MNIDTVYENKILCHFVYSPLQEMICALHVMCKDDHHLHRKAWVDKINNHMEESLKKEIREVAQFTEDYMIPLDFITEFPQCGDLNIPTSIDFLEDISIYKISRIIKYYNSNRKITMQQYKRLLHLFRNFYMDVFANELKYIEPFMTRILRKKSIEAKECGIKFMVESIHERIKMEDDDVVFYKYKNIRIKWSDIRNITINISTFISPHLLLQYGNSNINLTVLVELQNYEKKAPKDLENVLKALGDGTRLRILRKVGYKGKSTQELASTLGISEAAVSKSLKMLYEAKLLNKERKGNYMVYTLNTIQIDYLPYKIYEYIMQ